MAKAIYRIYRPSTFEEVSGQEHVVRTVQNQFKAGTLSHAYLFTGPRGVGKTTTARLIAKLANCLDPKGSEPCNTCDACTQVASGQALDVYEIDAASHTDVENVRENIIKSVRFAPNVLKKKVYIIDEVHMLSTSAFNALLKTLEEPPEHALFVLATTEIHKVPETIISRCQRFDFKRIPEQALLDRMGKILKAEKVEVDVDVLKEIARHSGGCARDAESLLGQVLALGDKKITMEEARLVLPATQLVLVEEFVAALKTADAAQGIVLLNQYLEQGVDLKHFVQDVIGWLRDRLMETVGGENQTYDVVWLQETLDELLTASRSIRGEHIPQLPVELAIVRVCRPAQSVVADSAPSNLPKQGVGSDRPDVKVKTQAPPNPPPKKPEVPPPPPSSNTNTSEFVEPSTDQSVNEMVEQAEVKGQVFDSVPVIDVDEVKKKWPQVYQQIKACNASLPMMMQSCEVSGMREDKLELCFEYDLYVDTVNKEKNRTLIEGIFEQVLGQRIRVKAVHKKKQEVDDPTLQNLVQEFGGTVI